MKRFLWTTVPIVLVFGCGEPERVPSGTFDGSIIDTGVVATRDGGDVTRDGGDDPRDGGTRDAGRDGGVMTVPDPGNASNDWGLTTGAVCCATPATAYPVGIVDTQPGYVQGNIDTTTGNFFYVFRTGPNFTDLDFNGGIIVDYIHLHEATGLIFGAEVTPIDTDQFGGHWTVQPDTVYVLELHAPGGGFF